MKYFFLKLGTGNEQADARLKLKPPNAAVFFDDLTKADYEKGLGKQQARLFWQRSQPEFRDSTLMVVISSARLRILRPAGKVTFSDRFKGANGNWLTTKEMPVEIVRDVLCKDVPPVLAGIACSQYHARRTFTEIGHWGNLKAIDCVLGRFNDPKTFQEEHWKPQDQTAAQLLECLGSTELETLVGKLFEAHGCHVPAYLGGTLPDIDIFAYNDVAQAIDVGGIRIAAGDRISIQVKTWSYKPRSKAVDYLISLSPLADHRSFGPDWVLQQVKQAPSVLVWMKRSLTWLPNRFLQQFGL